MGLNLKEKLQNINKKNVAIISLILVIVVVLAVGSFEYYQYHNVKIEKAKQESYMDSMPMDLSGQPKKPSEYKVGTEYDKAMRGKKPVLVLFYADWCHYCIRFMPIFAELAGKYSDDMEFSKVNVEDEKYQKLVNEIGITGFPTVFILDPKYDNKVLISNAYLGKTEHVSKELDRFIRIRKLLDKKK